MDEGRAALERGDWGAARREFERAVLEEGSPEALEGLGLAAWWLDAADVVFDSRERAYRGYLDRGDRPSAARVAAWIAWDTVAFRGEPAVANGWLQRAQRLLDGTPEATEHAWVALRMGVFALLEEGDPRAAQDLAARAVEVGKRHRAPDHELAARALHGFARVTRGEVAEGLHELDEVNAAVLAGEMTDRVLIGLACCYLIAACERIHDVDRAVQWCDRLKAFCADWGLRPLFAVCRTQYASVCLWRGDWDEAERELTTASDELLACRPGMTSEGLVRLGELRRRQGKLDEALALFERVEGHPLSSLGRAMVTFDRGDAKAAAARAERHLRRVPLESRTERAAALELLTRAHIQLGGFDEARRSLAELTAIAEAARTEALHGSASLAAGMLDHAEGDLPAARRRLEDAVDPFAAIRAPFEIARARVALARVLADLGRREAALDEARRAEAELTPLGAELELSRAAALVVELQGTPGAAPAAAPGGLTEREVEVLRLISEGLSNPAIAERLFISEHTVHRHVANTLNKLGVSSRSAAVAQAARLGLLS